MNTNKFYEFWKEWFAQSQTEKLKHLRQTGKGGYYPMSSEAPGYEAKADPKEYFHWRYGQKHPDSTWGSFTTSIFLDCVAKADRWCFEHGLGDLVGHVRVGDCVLRIIHYPASPTGNVGQAHKDFDLLTVSVPGTVPGLEVWSTDFPSGCTECVEDVCSRCYMFSANGGEWNQRETFEVHVGEMLEIYTATENYRTDFRTPVTPATLHRVRTPPNTERFKAVFFYLPPNDFELRPGFTAGDYLKGALTKAGTINVGAK